MKTKNLVEQYLRLEPQFRERRFKDRGIVNLLMKRHFNLDQAIRQGVLLTKEFMVELVQEYATMDRAWRQALEQDPTLRGNDYDDKARLEDEHKIALGYGPGHDADVKKLGTLV